MSTPERSRNFFENSSRRLCLNPLEIDDDQQERETVRRQNLRESSSKKSKMWSIRSRRDEPNLLRGDRFIPRRMDLDCDFALDRLVSENFHSIKPKKKSTKRTLKLLEEILPQNRRIYNFGVKTHPQRMMDPSDVARRIEALTITSKERYISSTPERILDAPDLIDDFYLNLIDWGPTSNMIAVALMNCVFLWDDQTGNVTKLLELQTPNSNLNGEDDDDELIHYVSSVAWHCKSSYLAVGTSYQQVHIYDVQQQICKRKLISENTLEDDDRIPCLAWNENVIACGTRNSGDILLYDVRQKNSIALFRSHRQEVCGLKWCPNGRYLASGSNDNTVCVWDFQNNRQSNKNLSQPLWHFKEHRAAVKAIAWCPWEGSKVLVTGGGHSDGYLRFWNNNNGTCQKSVKTDSQISSIVWSTDYKQMVTGQGHPNNFIHIWHYPSMEKAHSLHGHTSRILSLIMGPKGNPIVSLSADETIRFWNCFPVDVEQKKKLEMTRTQSYPSKLNFNSR